jgi:protein-L-isoaspartate(D-aspartate) O-methyltransferase
MSRICGYVFTIEIHDELASQAQRRFATLGYRNIEVRVGDGYAGWPEHGPYDGIIVTCAPSHIPRPLTDQLAEGGRMIIPVGRSGVQELYLMVKQQGRFTQQAQFEVLFVPMTGRNGDVY